MTFVMNIHNLFNIIIIVLLFLNVLLSSIRSIQCSQIDAEMQRLDERIDRHQICYNKGLFGVEDEIRLLKEKIELLTFHSSK